MTSAISLESTEENLCYQHQFDHCHKKCINNKDLINSDKKIQSKFLAKFCKGKLGYYNLKFGFELICTNKLTYETEEKNFTKAMKDTDIKTEGCGDSYTSAPISTLITLGSSTCAPKFYQILFIFLLSYLLT